jgi:hypothetical protein
VHIYQLLISGTWRLFSLWHHGLNALNSPVVSPEPVRVATCVRPICHLWWHMLALFQRVCSSLDTDGLFTVKFLDFTVKREYKHSAVSELTAEAMVLSTFTRGYRCDIVVLTSLYTKLFCWFYCSTVCSIRQSFGLEFRMSGFKSWPGDRLSREFPLIKHHAMKTYEVIPFTEFDVSLKKMKRELLTHK